MKVYEVWWNDPQEGLCMDWCATKVQVTASLINHADFQPNVTVRVIPTTKKGLVQWLNDNFTKDNG